MSSRLIIVVARFFPDSYGGAERQALILAEALGEMGVDVTIVAPSLDPDVPALEETPFGRIERFKAKGAPSDGGRRILSFFAWSWWFYRRFSNSRYQGVPIYVFHARLHAFGPALAARRSKSQLLIKLGGGGESFDFIALQAKRFFYGRWVQRLLLKQTDLFVANGVLIAEDLISLHVPPHKIAVFPNGVILPKQELVNEAMLDRSGSRFIYTGRIHADKRVDVLCEAAAALLSEGKEVNLVLLGDGPARQALDDEFGSGSSLQGITFPGFASEIYPHVLASDFFVSASLREGQSNALLEAMSVGTIPIVCAASGVADVIVDGINGFIVEGSDSSAFEVSMRRALSLSREQRQAMSQAARSFAEANVSIAAVAQKTLEYLRGVINEAGSIQGKQRLSAGSMEASESELRVQKSSNGAAE